MFNALWYYQYQSWRNRLAFRLRRLRQPKYMVGAIAGGAYFYFYAGYFLQIRKASAPSALTETLSAFGLLVVALLSWLLPQKRGGLGFSEAEIAMLFPAPFTRKQLIRFKLFGSQATMLFGALFVTLVRHGATSGHFITRTLGWFVGISVLSMHTNASSVSISMLMDRGMTPKKRRLIIFGILALVAAAIFLWAKYTMPLPPADMKGNAGKWFQDYLSQAMKAGPLPYLLAPFRLIIAPYFSTSFKQFFIALGPAAAIWFLHYAWVMRADYAFEEGSIEQARRVAEFREARAGHGGPVRALKKAARAPFALRPLGHPSVAIFWKNLISAGQYVTVRFWLFLFVIAVVGGVVMKTAFADSGGMGPFIFQLLAVVLSLTLFSGPQLLRCDLRQDLKSSDVLKLLPMPGWQIVLGEVLAPAAMLASVQWVLLAYALVFCPGEVEGHAIPMSLRLGIALGAAMVLPFIDLLAIVTPNAFVLFFPAWIQTGRDVPRGFETMGQRLVLMIGQMFALALGIILPAAAFCAFLFGAKALGFAAIGIVTGSFAAALLLAVEIGLAIRLRGGVFERFDVSGEPL